MEGSRTEYVVLWTNSLRFIWDIKIVLLDGNVFRIVFKSIYKFGLSVCLFVSNKRQKGWTNRAQIFCGTSRDPREGLWMIEILKICVLEVFNFVKKILIFENPQIFFKNPQNFFHLCFEM